MIQLLDLANELLLAIIDEVRVEDIEAFTMSNKRIHSLSQHVLEKHRAMKKKYSVFQLNSGTLKTLDVSLKVHPLVWIRKIILNETVASYHTHLYIEYRSADQAFIFTGLNSEIIKRIYSKLEQCQYIQRKDLKEWKLDIFSEFHSFDTALALLLTLLPNLQSIFFDYSSQWTHRTTCMLAWISKANQTDQTRPHALSRLISLDPTLDTYRWAFTKPLDFYLPFTGLPSVRSVSGDRVNGHYNRYFGVPSMPHGFEDAEGVLKTFKSGITTIKFTNRKISSSGFEDLLCRIGALQDFEYEYTGYELGGFEPRKIVNSLLRNAGHSLVRLHLTDENPINSPDRWDNGERVPHGKIFIGSLREFQVLKTITVNNAMLVEKNLNTETGGKESFKIHRLVDLLPTSIEKLSVDSHEQFCLPGNIFDGLVESEAQRFPKLKKIELDYYEAYICNMKEAYHELGIEVLYPESLA